MLFYVSCVPANSANRRRRAVDANADIQADYQVAMDPTPPNVEPMNVSSLVESVEAANTEVAETGVEINGVRVTGTTRQVALVPGKLVSPST